MKDARGEMKDARFKMEEERCKRKDGSGEMEKVRRKI
jgi:hypothetical protein